MDDFWHNSITEVEKTQLESALLNDESGQFPLDKEWYRNKVRELLDKIPVYGYAPYDPTYGDDRLCKCGHPYYRHFDTYENMAPVGCKYCNHYDECERFEEAV